MKRSGDSLAVVVAIVVIGALVGYALHRGMDGALLTLGVGAIAALGGVKLGDIFRNYRG